MIFEGMMQVTEKFCICTYTADLSKYFKYIIADKNFKSFSSRVCNYIVMICFGNTDEEVRIV